MRPENLERTQDTRERQSEPHAVPVESRREGAGRPSTRVRDSCEPRGCLD